MVPLTHEAESPVKKIIVLQEIWYVPMSRDKKRLTVSQKIETLKFRYIYLREFVH